MGELWTRDEAAFEGKYVKFSPVRLYPQPKQKSGPPILIGSKDRNALRGLRNGATAGAQSFFSQK